MAVAERQRHGLWVLPSAMTLLAKLMKSKRLFLIDNFGTDLLYPFFVELVLGSAVYSLLVVVHKILYQVGKHL